MDKLFAITISFVFIHISQTVKSIQNSFDKTVLKQAIRLRPDLTPKETKREREREGDKERKGRGKETPTSVLLC